MISQKTDLLLENALSHLNKGILKSNDGLIVEKSLSINDTSVIQLVD